MKKMLSELANIKRSIAQNKAKREVIEQDIASLRLKLRRQKRRLSNAEKARAVLQHVAQETTSKIEDIISNPVTLALQAVIDNSPQFVANFKRKRNTVECNLYFKEYDETYKPINQGAGGALNVASLACRIVKLMMKDTRKILILDEPFRDLDHSQQHKAGKLLRTLHEKMGIQFIVISHQPEVDDYAHRVFEVEKNGKYSEIRKVR